MTKKLIWIFGFIFSAICIGLIVFVFVLTNRKKSCAPYFVCSNCNLLLISTDSLRTDHTSLYGYKRDTTPFLKQVAFERGIIFENHFTPSYLTAISEMSLHTGLYPLTHGETDYHTILPESTKTLAQQLKINGFFTSALHTSPEYTLRPAIKESFTRGFDRYKDLSLRDIDVNSINSIDKELSLLKNKRFFFWLTIGSVHWPYGKLAPDRYTKPSYKGFLREEELGWGIFHHIYKGILYGQKGPKAITQEDIQYVIDMYDNGIRKFDDDLSQIFTMLKEKKLDKNTIVILYTPHAEDLYDHGYFAHYDITDEQIHTPLIIFHPNVNKGTRISRMISSIDIFPTIFEMLGLQHPYSQGTSILSLLCGKTPAKWINKEEYAVSQRIPLWEEIVFYENMDTKPIIDAFPDDKRDIAIRTKKWKYIERRSKPLLETVSWWKNLTGMPISISDTELYDLENDPRETKNIAETYPQTVEKMKRLLSEWEKQYFAPVSHKIKYETVQEYF